MITAVLITAVVTGFIYHVHDNRGFKYSGCHRFHIPR
ncbi:unnamed protein product, partial [Rotaria sp. Silwood2]